MAFFVIRHQHAAEQCMAQDNQILAIAKKYRLEIHTS